jgi:hypothetical protein
MVDARTSSVYYRGRASRRTTFSLVGDQPNHRPHPKFNRTFQSAVAIAQAQKAKPWELRAATSMARLWRDRGERDKARVVKLLAPVDG